MDPSPYGLHRVVQPPMAFPQAAEKLNVALPICSNEILISVDRLNLDSASFHQILESSHHHIDQVKKKIADIIKARGKMHNPVTNSGGTLLGTIQEVGKKAEGKGFKTGERVASLVSLTLTPLHLETIGVVNVSREQLEVKGYAILFESGILHRLPPDMPEDLALAIFDVCGAPALVSSLCPVGATVVVLGAGKAGLLVAAKARKKIGKQGKIIVFEKNERAVQAAQGLSFIDDVFCVDLTDPLQTHDIVLGSTQARMADLVVNCVNVPGTEMSSILAAKKSGTVLFFNMTTNFQAAVLGAEGVGHEARLVMGNGYYPGHADLAIDLIREYPPLRKWFEDRVKNGG